ncbi:Maf1-domain-containing protein [Fomitiporia mediterranea MF3/22]|uniref:Maf1-domain-containing protein n=1 Tax=Fomitiporia mediterranea (strain MF3/22) TaxID=694068 RepID=UPI000440850A|nr:Maf1-domain-containing protein [Fomitiporia mediterranea MF3/22]EJD06459.1 Maf1-domain-containing protein [Fomitiporia mediterranea MF3/22]
MKYIEFPELERLSQALTHEGPECSVHTRIEAYSCKNVNRDKKLFRALEHAYAEEAAHSPPLPSFAALDKEADNTPFGPMDKHASRKTLYSLIATLNIAFPDHEFAGVRPAHFCKEHSGAGVLNALSTTLVTAGSNGSPTQRPGMPAPRTYSAYPPTSSDFFPSSLPTSSSPVNSMMQSPLAPPPIVTGTHPTLFRVLDEVIGLADCEVYSYVPDIASDPHATDYSDNEDEPAPADDDDSLSESDDEVFAFDDYDVDEVRTSRMTHMSSGGIDIPRRKSSDTDSDGSPLRVRLRRRGALLWSSHWFFLNRKLKRILFISVCARTKGGHQWMSDDEIVYGSPERLSSNERFLGWEGSAGAGARALGISIKSSA